MGGRFLGLRGFHLATLRVAIGRFFLLAKGGGSDVLLFS